MPIARSDRPEPPHLHRPTEFAKRRQFRLVLVPILNAIRQVENTVGRRNDDFGETLSESDPLLMPDHGYKKGHEEFPRGLVCLL